MIGQSAALFMNKAPGKAFSVSLLPLQLSANLPLQAPGLIQLHPTSLPHPLIQGILQTPQGFLTAFIPNCSSNLCFTHFFPSVFQVDLGRGIQQPMTVYHVAKQKKFGFEKMLCKYKLW